MRELGPIVRLQVQRSGLKNPSPPDAAHHRHFDPAPLLDVPALLLTADGVFGLPNDEKPVVDVHNTAHPATRNAVVNGISVGFTAHYTAIAERFGDHLGLGVAGENVIVRSASIIDEAAVAGGLAIKTADGSLVALTAVQVAEPCVEFTRYALRLGLSEPSNEHVTDGLRFLRHGMRGFYATYAGDAGDEVVLRTGDLVFAVD